MKDPMSRPAVHKERGGPCPACKIRLGVDVPTVARRSRKTKELLLRVHQLWRILSFQRMPESLGSRLLTTSR